MFQIGRLFSLCAAIIAFNASLLRAAAYNWTGAVDTSYETLGNYLVGGSVPSTLPGITDSLTASGTITSNATATTYSLRWMYVPEGGSANFNFNGNTLELVSADITSSTSIRGNMTWQNGTLRTMGTQPLLLGAFNPQTVPVTVLFTGSTAILDAAGPVSIGAYIKSGSTATTTLTIDNGAKLNAKTVYVAGSATTSQGQFATATLNVTGAGSVADLQSTNLILGNATDTTSTVNVSAGGEIKGVNTVYIGNNANTTAALTVSGANSKLTAAGIVVDGASGTGTTTLQVHSGGEATVNGNVTTGSRASIFVGVNGTITSQNFYLNQGNTSGGKTASLMGSGTIASTVAGTHNVNLYGVVKPGDTLSGTGIGTLTLGSGAQSVAARLSSNSALTMDFASASSYDQIAIFGSLSATTNLGDLVLDFSNFTGGPNAGQYTLISTTGSLGGTFNSVTWIGATGSISYGANSILITSAVPEPSTYALLTAGAILALAVRCRRKRALQL